MSIYIKQSDFDTIVAHAIAELPNEACGLVAGRIDGEDRYIERVYTLSNPDRSPEHFSIDPKEQLSAIKDMRQNGLVPLGNFHSHPSTPARPSEEDIRLAYDPQSTYMILSLAEKNPVLKAFRIADATVTAEPIEFIL